MPSCGMRRRSVCVHMHKLLLLPDKRAGLPSNLHTVVPTLVCIRDVLKVEVKVQAIWTVSPFPLLLQQLPHSTTMFHYACMGLLTIHM